jgi:hypothetical protein
MYTGRIFLLARPEKPVRLRCSTTEWRKTIAQFLLPGGMTPGRHLIAEAERADYKTVIIDECSMLTEDQFAALLMHSSVERLILLTPAAATNRQGVPLSTRRRLTHQISKRSFRVGLIHGVTVSRRCRTKAR